MVYLQCRWGEIAPAQKYLSTPLSNVNPHIGKTKTSELQRDNRSEGRTKVFQFYDGGVIARAKVSVMYKCRRLKITHAGNGPRTS
jgi:hypothetical protein